MVTSGTAASRARAWPLAPGSAVLRPFMVLLASARVPAPTAKTPPRVSHPSRHVTGSAVVLYRPGRRCANRRRDTHTRLRAHDAGRWAGGAGRGLKEPRPPRTVVDRGDRAKELSRRCRPRSRNGRRCRPPQRVVGR
jgi:hypothetical protein